MKRIYDFSRNPAKRNFTISDLRALKGHVVIQIKVSAPADA